MQQNVPFEGQESSFNDVCCVLPCVIMEQNYLILFARSLVLKSRVPLTQLIQIDLIVLCLLSNFMQKSIVKIASRLIVDEMRRHSGKRDSGNS